MPTEAERQGDFKSVAKVGGTPAPLLLFDPLNVRLEGGRYVRGPFANSIIPANRIDPAGASLLLGFGDTFVRPSFALQPTLSVKYVALDSQNDWRVTNRLTLNLGLRWDLQPGPTERYNRMMPVNLGITNKWGALGKWVFPTTSGTSRNYWDNNSLDLQPRFELAYRIREDFVIRAGYGLSMIPSNTGFNGGPGHYNMTAFAPSTLTTP